VRNRSDYGQALLEAKLPCMTALEALASQTGKIGRVCDAGVTHTLTPTSALTALCSGLNA